MSEELSAENDAPHYFDADDLKYLGYLSGKIEALTEWYGARLVVAVWDKGDQRPVAWVECHPDDSNATVRFGPEEPAEKDALPPALRAALIEWVVEACEKYGLPLTNNYPRVQDGVQLHHIGDFTGDLLRAAERAMTRVVPPGSGDAG